MNYFFCCFSKNSRFLLKYFVDYFFCCFRKTDEKTSCRLLSDVFEKKTRWNKKKIVFFQKTAEKTHYFRRSLLHHRNFLPWYRAYLFSVRSGLPHLPGAPAYQRPIYRRYVCLLTYYRWYTESWNGYDIDHSIKIYMRST